MAILVVLVKVVFVIIIVVMIIDALLSDSDYPSTKSGGEEEQRSKRIKLFGERKNFFSEGKENGDG